MSTENTVEFKFRKGDCVHTGSLIGVIRDVLLSSEDTGNVAVYISFIHNLGNARKYDILELRPGIDLGTSKWRLATAAEWSDALLSKEIQLTVAVQDVSFLAQRFADQTVNCPCWRDNQ